MFAGALNWALATGEVIDTEGSRLETTLILIAVEVVTTPLLSVAFAVKE